MTSIVLGPFALMTSTALVLLAVIVFWLTLWWLCRNQSFSAKASDLTFYAIAVGFISSRLAFVISMWSLYSEQWLSILDIRDGGFKPVIGWLVATLVMLAGIQRQRDLVARMLKAGAVEFLPVCKETYIILGHGESKFTHASLINEYKADIRTRLLAGL